MSNVWHRRRKRFACWLISLLVFWVGDEVFAAPPADADWKANAVIDSAATVSDSKLGAAQGVGLHDGHLYFYGDRRRDKEPRAGIIREYTLDLTPTGREIQLSRDGSPLALHPTGLTWDSEFGCFLGDTVNRKATLYKLDWLGALKGGNLDGAVQGVIVDDLATNGCRPEFVTRKGRRLLATADYGNVHTAVRLYDLTRLAAAERSSAPEVLVAEFPCGPFNQNLSWDAVKGRLTCVENVVAGRGWKLDVFDLEKAAADGRNLRPARVQTLIFAPHTELEGWHRLPGDREVFVTSSSRDNIIVGKSRLVTEFASPKGTTRFSEEK